VPATLDTLLQDRTKADELALLMGELQANEFPVTDWNVGGAAHTWTLAIAAGLADKSALIKIIASGVHPLLAKALLDASGNPVLDWVNLLAEQWYDLERVLATFTIQRCRISCTAGAGPQTVNPGFIAWNPNTGNRYIFNGTATVVPDAGSVDVDLTAESPGAKYNDVEGTIIEIVTPLPGLSITNPPTTFGGLGVPPAAKKGGSNAGTGTVTPSTAGTPVLSRQFIITVTATGAAGSTGSVSIDVIEGSTTTTTTVSPIPATYSAGDAVTLTFANGAGVGFVVGDVHTFQTPGTARIQQGSDDETNDSVVSRCIGRWPSLGLNNVTDKYVMWVRQCSLDNGYGIEKVAVRPSATVAGQVDLTIATASGTASGTVVTAVQNYINARSGITEKGNVIAASTLDVVPTGTVTVRNEDIDTVKAAADAAWRAYIIALPIGGDVATGTPGVVRLSELVQAIMDAGAIDYSGLQLNGAAVNKALATSTVGVIGSGGDLSASLTWTAVA